MKAGTIYWRIRADDEVKELIQEIAKGEYRKEVDMIRILVMEALRARGKLK